VAEKSPEEAIQNFVRSFQDTVGCITERYLFVYQESRKRYRLFFKVPAQISSRNGSRFYISVAQIFTVEEREDETFKIHTREYSYVFSDSPIFSHHGLVSYHWHPDEFALRDPHLHIKITPNMGYPEIERKIARAHYPTSRVFLEDFIGLLIQHYDIRPLLHHSAWRRILRRNKRAFSEQASWIISP